MSKSVIVFIWKQLKRQWNVRVQLDWYKATMCGLSKEMLKGVTIMFASVMAMNLCRWPKVVNIRGSEIQEREKNIHCELLSNTALPGWLVSLTSVRVVSCKIQAMNYWTARKRIKKTNWPVLLVVTPSSYPTICAGASLLRNTSRPGKNRSRVRLRMKAGRCLYQLC